MTDAGSAAAGCNTIHKTQITNLLMWKRLLLIFLQMSSR